MAKKRTKYEYKLYDSSRRTGESLEQQYKRLYTIADKRMQRLEAASLEPGFQNILQYSYSTAIAAIQGWAEGSIRFKHPLPLNEDGSVDEKALKTRIKDIQNFLESPTSSKRSITQIYKYRAKTTNETMKKLYPDWQDLTWQEYAAYYESALFKKLANQRVASTTLLVTYAERIKSGESAKDIKDAAASNMFIADDDIIAKEVKKIAKEFGRDLDKAADNVGKYNKNLKKDKKNVKKTVNKVRKAVKIAKKVSKYI